MSIEVEKRGIFDKATFDRLPKVLFELGANDLGPNDTETFFYVLENGQLKVQNQINKGTAKIVWKSGGFDGRSARNEVELTFDQKDVKSARDLLKKLFSNAKEVKTIQNRHDYRLEGTTISLKYSEHWGYHIEIDRMVEDSNAVADAEKLIASIASKLGVALFTQDEEQKFVAKILKKI